MKERPIRFNAPMVRALLNGSKTQTRRVVKPTPEADQVLGTITGSRGFVYSIDQTPFVQYPAVRRIRWDCPYGQPGDLLWVRETWRGIVQVNGPHEPYQTGVARYVPDPEHCKKVEYAATYTASCKEAWLPSIHMPRWASRITLEVTAVRVERLHDITADDAMVEGIVRLADGGYAADKDGRHYHAASARHAYASLWEPVNGPDSWDANPWVWVIEFRRY